MRAIMKMLVAAVTMALAPSAAQAYDTTTRWHTIGTQPLSDGGQPLFLTLTSNGVKLQPYRSGDATQLWARVWPNFPGAIDVEVDKGLLEGMLDCIGLHWGCDFEATDHNTPIKIVNQADGRCLVFSGSTAATVNCRNTAAESEKQGWVIWKAGELVAGAYQPIVSNGACLTAFNARARPDLFAAGGSDCERPLPKEVLFVVQMAAEISCQTSMPFNLCFKTGKN